MNIMRQEFKQEFKPFIIWTIGIGFLMFGGMVKFIGVSGTDTAAMAGFMSAFPKAVLALFGMAEADIETFGGFYAILQFFVMIAIACYGVHLGTNAVLRESNYKTYEFLFTKPYSRTRILGLKLAAGFLYLLLICILNAIFSYSAPALYGIMNDISMNMILFPIAVFLVSLLFFACSALISVWLHSPERAVQISYAVLLLTYAVSVVFDMDERFEILRPLTPFKYFRASELIDGKISYIYFAAVVIMTAICITAALHLFRRKDLKAV